MKSSEKPSGKENRVFYQFFVVLKAVIVSFLANLREPDYIYAKKVLSDLHNNRLMVRSLQ